jgi:hypothetical protein
MWDGDAVLDRARLFEQHTEGVEAPQTKSTRSSETSVCGYCGVEYVLTEGHSCLQGVPAGTVVKRSDGTFLIILESDDSSVTYYQIPEATKVSLEKFVEHHE